MIENRPSVAPSSCTVPTSLFYPEAADDTALIGLPTLMEMAFRGLDLNPQRQRLLDRLRRDPNDANAMLDLSSVMFLMDQDDLGCSLQREALSISRHYTLPARGTPRLRLLTLMTPGRLMANIPLEFLLSGSNVTLEMLYLDPDAPALWTELPPHDVACVGVCVSPATKGILQALAGARSTLPHATLNDPNRILALARETVWQTLRDIPGCTMPPSRALNRAALNELAGQHVSLDQVLPGAAFPIICRPNGSHAGQGLAKLTGPADLAAYLSSESADEFVISPFVDYVSADGQYRKYRIAFIGGKAFPVHMAASARWMVHYLNGDMLDRPDNRAEECRFFDEFTVSFGQRHASALAAIDDRLGLDYVSIDCGETQDGRLLVFECDTGGVAHAMDPLQDFGYKRPHMLALFAAFQDLLARAAQDRRRLKPWILQ